MAKAAVIRTIPAPVSFGSRQDLLNARFAATFCSFNRVFKEPRAWGENTKRRLVFQSSVELFRTNPYFSVCFLYRCQRLQGSVPEWGDLQGEIGSETIELLPPLLFLFLLFHSMLETFYRAIISIIKLPFK